MKRSNPVLATWAVIFSLFSLPLWGQTIIRYDFDGVADEDPQPDDPTDWSTSVNWCEGSGEDCLDPFVPFRPEIPDMNTRVEIQVSTFGVNAPVIDADDAAEAREVRIGRFGGEGLLTMTGGTLTTSDSCNGSPFTCNRRFRVGNADVALPEDRNPGTFDMSGGVLETDSFWIGSGSLGTMNMSGGTVNVRGDLSLDWTFDAGSVLNMTGGTINVGTSAFAQNPDLRMYRSTELNLDGGEIVVSGFVGLGFADDAVTQSPDATVNIDSGLLEAGEELILGGSVVIDGGILRADSFDEAMSSGTVEVNAGGLLQFNNANESVSAVEALITGGVFTTSESTSLSVDVVDVGGVDFTQVSVLAAGVAGDYNGNGIVDAADYAIWIANLGATGTPGTLIGDGTSTGNLLGTPDGVVDRWDYDFWAANIGNTSGSGSGGSIPEPTSLCLLLMMPAGIGWVRNRV